MRKTCILSAICLFVTSSLYAQFTTPVINGSIGTNEYGNHTGGQNQYTNSAVWYCSWDNTNIYFAVSGGFNASSDAINVYIDVNPSDLVNAGTGLTTGTGYDGVTPDLPFSADAFLFVKSGYKDRNVVSSGSWSSNNGSSSSISDFVNTGSNIVEFSVPWSVLGVSARPDEFNWLGHISYSGGGGGCFAHVPSANPGGTTPDYVRYWTIDTTTNGTPVQPFEKESYCHVGASIPSFGPINIYDFTMNTSATSITRAAGNWQVRGDLKVGAGTISFGSAATTAEVLGDVKIYTGGTLEMGSNGDGMDLKRHLTNNGTFVPYGAEVALTGSDSQSISGTFNGTLTNNHFSSLKIENTTGVTLNTDASIYQYSTSTCRLALQGLLDLNGNQLLLEPNCSIVGSFSSTEMIVATSGHVRQELASNGSRLYPLGGTDYSPITLDFLSGSYAAGAYIDLNVTETKHPQNSSPSNYLNRYWTVNSSGISSFSSDITMEYPSGDVSGTETSIYSAKYSGSSWTLGSANSTSGELTFSGNTSFSDFTGGEVSFLPVNLLTFDGHLSNNQIELNWSTASELNNDYFKIVKVVNGQEEVIGEVAGNTSANAISQYEFLDYEVLAENRYYLYQVDLDGTEQFVGQTVVYVEDKEPTIKVDLIDLILHSTEEIIELTIYDMQGKQVCKLKGNEQHAIELPSYLRGRSAVFLFNLETSSSFISKRILLL